MAVTQTGAIYKSLIFDGKSSRSYGVYITGEAVYNAPVREVEMINIPGRNGSLALDKGRFENIEVSYPAGIFADTEADFAQAISDFRNFLCSRSGYVRLTDEYNPNEYRMAVYKSGLEVTPAQLRAGEFNIVFDCKPQRWLTSGETEVVVISGDTITNPTLFEASPLLLVDGYGEIEFGDYSISIENVVIGQVSVYGGRAKSQISGRTLTIHIDASMLNSGDSIYFDGLTWYLLFSKKSQSGISGQTCSVYSSSNAVGATDTNGQNRTIALNSSTFTYGTAGSITGNVAFQHNYTQSGVAKTETVTFSVTATYDGATDISIELTVPTMVAYLLSAKQLEIPAFNAYSTVSILGTPIYIDCDLGEAYKYEGDTLVSLNSVINLGSDLPVLASGANTVTFDNTITDLKVVPRWWKV